MLTREGDRYILTAFDLTTGRTLAVLELMTLPGESVHGYFFTDEGYLLAVLGKHIALVDTASRTLLLTAPDAADQTFGARSYNNDIGTIRFDGRTLILSDAAHYREGSFLTAAWRQDDWCTTGNTTVPSCAATTTGTTAPSARKPIPSP